MAALLLLLFSAGVLLPSIEAQEAYSKLPDKYRKGVDLALQQLNSHAGVKHHFLFFKSLLKSDIEVKPLRFPLLGGCFSEDCGNTVFLCRPFW